MTDPSLCSSLSEYPSMSQSSPELFPVEEDVDSSSSHVTDFLRGRVPSSLPSSLSSHLSITLVNRNCQSHLSIKYIYIYINCTCQSHLPITAVNQMSVMSITSTYHMSTTPVNQMPLILSIKLTATRDPWSVHQANTTQGTLSQSKHMYKSTT